MFGSLGDEEFWNEAGSDFEEMGEDTFDVTLDVHYEISSFFGGPDGENSDDEDNDDPYGNENPYGEPVH